MKAGSSTLPFLGPDPKPRRFGSRAFYTLAGIPLVLFTFSYGLRRLEYAITFHPERYSVDQQRQIPKGGEDVWFTTRDNVKLNGLFVSSAKKTAAATILFFHGNGGNLSHIDWLAESLSGRGFDALFFDYRGYGASEGEVTGEADLYADADAAYDYLVNQCGVSPDRIVLYGQSLGTTAAADLASRKQCGGVILESGLSSASKVASTTLPWLPQWLHALGKNRFESARKLRSVHCPILIAHGEPDGTVPTDNGRDLFAAANGPKRLIIMPGADHCVFCFGGDKYLDEIAAFARAAVAQE
jgi:uncharacterized protein